MNYFTYTSSMDVNANSPMRQTMTSMIPEMLGKKSVGVERFDPAYLKSHDRYQVEVPEDHPALTITPEQRQIHDAANASQAEKNPFLAEVMKDPGAFKKELESRFQRQKELTPEDPYQFEFGDYGVPVLKDLDEMLNLEIAELGEKREKGLRGTGFRSGISAAFGAIGDLFNPFKWFDDPNKDQGIAYLKELQNEVQEHIEKDSISYRRLQELGHYSATALGHFDDEDLGLRDRSMLVVDRYLLGKDRANIAEEQRRFQENDFALFRKDAGDRGIRRATATFEYDFFNPDRLEMVALPVARSLGPGIFMQLLPHDMFLLGITREPEEADGFNRPGGDFYLHDMRHASSIYTKRKIYEKEHNLSQPQKEKLEVMQSVWKKELTEERKKIESKEMRYAIGFLGFNHHHDRGVPQLPSSFLVEDPDTVCLWLYRALKISGQPTGFEKPKETIKEAYNWLRDFWLERLPQEEAILAVSQPSGDAGPR